MTALEIVKEVCAVLREDIPATITNAGDTTTAAVLAITNRAIEAVRTEHNWQKCRSGLSFEASVNHPYYNPATGGINIEEYRPDIDEILTAALFQKGNYMTVNYLRPDKFELLRANGIGSVQKYFTMADGEIIFLPKLTAEPFTCSFMYKSKYAVKDEEGTYKRGFTRDADTFVLDDELLILCSVYKNLQALKMAYAEEMADYQERLLKSKNTDIIMPVIEGRGEDGGRVAANLPENIPTGGI